MITEHQWTNGLRRLMSPDGSAKGERQQMGRHDLSLFISSMRAVSDDDSSFFVFIRSLVSFMCFPVIYAGLFSTSFAPILFFSYRYLLPKWCQADELSGGGLATIGMMTLGYLALLGAAGLFLYLVATARSDATAAAEYGYYAEAYSEGLYPLILWVFAAFTAALAFARQTQARIHAWETAQRIGRMTHGKTALHERAHTRLPHTRLPHTCLPHTPGHTLARAGGPARGARGFEPRGTLSRFEAHERLVWEVRAPGPMLARGSHGQEMLRTPRSPGGRCCACGHADPHAPHP